MGQNYGAGKKDRIKKSVLYCLGIVIVLGLAVGLTCTFLSEQLLNLFLDKGTDPVAYAEALSFGVERLALTLPVYFMCGVMEVGTGALRAMNKSAISMVGSIIGACGLRILWIYTIFAASPTIKTLFLSYPITWSLTSIYMYGVLIYYYKKLKPRF